MFGCWDDGGRLGATPTLLGPPVQMYADNSGGGVPTPAPPVLSNRGQSLAMCLAYVEKYKRVYGRTPNVWCVGQTMPAPTDVTGGIKCAPGTQLSADGKSCVPILMDYQPPVETWTVPAETKPPIVRQWQPPIRVQPPVSTGPVWGWWRWRRRRPRPARPWVDWREKRREDRQPVPVTIAPVPVELCPIRGYVSREIPGANEYQNFRCTPGQPVVIDRGLQAVGAAEARARHGLSDFGELGTLEVGNIIIPTWALLAGAGLAAFLFLKKGR